MPDNYLNILFIYICMYVYVEYCFYNFYNSNYVKFIITYSLIWFHVAMVGFELAL